MTSVCLSFTFHLYLFAIWWVYICYLQSVRCIYTTISICCLFVYLKSVYFLSVFCLLVSCLSIFCMYVDFSPVCLIFVSLCAVCLLSAYLQSVCRLFLCLRLSAFCGHFFACSSIFGSIFLFCLFIYSAVFLSVIYLLSVCCMSSYYMPTICLLHIYIRFCTCSLLYMSILVSRRLFIFVPLKIMTQIASSSTSYISGLLVNSYISGFIKSFHIFIS